MDFKDFVPDKEIENTDQTEYVAVVLARLLAEPIGLLLSVFLAFLFMVPTQIPDMVDPYFQRGASLLPGMIYTALAGWMAYTVWFWMLAAIRAEALIPGGRYYMPYGAKERGYVSTFGEKGSPWYKPFMFAANFAALFAFFSCMSRPIFLLLDSATDTVLGFILTSPLIWVIWLSLYWIAFGEPTDKRNSIFASIFAGTYILGFAWFGVGAVVFLVVAITSVLGAFALIAISERLVADTKTSADSVLTMKRRDLTWFNRFSPAWSFRLAALLLASPHRVSRGKGDPLVKWLLRAFVWCLHVTGPIGFIIFLYWNETNDLSIDFATPVAALLSLTMSVGPLVIFLSFTRDVCEHLLIAMVDKERRAEHIRIQRRFARTRFAEDVSNYPKERDPGIERISYGTYQVLTSGNTAQRVNAATRVFARFGAIFIMSLLFFSNSLENFQETVLTEESRHDTLANDYTPSSLNYHISGALGEDAIGLVDKRPGLSDALLSWKSARADLMQEHIGRSGTAEVPVVIVAASGGANRAAVWSMSMLHHLNSGETEGRLNSHIFAFSGVSGGALGAVTYAFHVERSLNHDIPAWNWPLEEAARHDLLAPSIAYFFNVDLLKRFDFGPLRIAFSDRSEILERTFEKSWARFWNLKDMHSAGLLDSYHKSSGRMPLLLLNGVDSRSGRRVLTSTLEISGNEFPDAQDFFRRFGRDVRPATAVMNSARFPLISSSGRYFSVNEPCMDGLMDRSICPPDLHHQIIDGGYYENSGVQTAFELAQAIEGIAEEFAKTHDWRPMPVILAISNEASGVISGMNEGKILKVAVIGEKTVFQAPRGRIFPEFTSATATCSQRSMVSEVFVSDAEEFGTEIGSIVRGALNTAQSHNHRSMRLAMEAYCSSPSEDGRRRVDRFLHFGLPRPVEAGQSAPMNWVLSDSAVEYLTKLAPSAVITAQTEQVNALRRLLIADPE